MQVSKFIELDETFEIRDVRSDHTECQCLSIGEFSERVELFFDDLNHLKQFSEQLNKQIKEIEK